MTTERITSAELDYDTRHYLRHAVSDVLRGILPVPPGRKPGPDPNHNLDQVLEGKRPRPRHWPALIVIGRDGLEEAA